MLWVISQQKPEFHSVRTETYNYSGVSKGPVYNKPSKQMLRYVQHACNESCMHVHEGSAFIQHDQGYIHAHKMSARSRLTSPLTDHISVPPRAIKQWKRLMPNFIRVQIMGLDIRITSHLATFLDSCFQHTTVCLYNALDINDSL